MPNPTADAEVLRGKLGDVLGAFVDIDGAVRLEVPVLAKSERW
jgi:hypothetical protein